MKVLEVTSDAVYIQYRHKDAKFNRVIYDSMDWLELAKQKVELIKTINRDRRGSLAEHPLDGLLSLIDDIQDDAEAKGYPVVWAHDPLVWQSGELDLDKEDEETDE